MNNENGRHKWYIQSQSYWNKEQRIQQSKLDAATAVSEYSVKRTRCTRVPWIERIKQFLAPWFAIFSSDRCKCVRHDSTASSMHNNRQMLHVRSVYLLLVWCAMLKCLAWCDHCHWMFIIRMKCAQDHSACVMTMYGGTPKCDASMLYHTFYLWGWWLIVILLQCA